MTLCIFRKPNNAKNPLINQFRKTAGVFMKKISVIGAGNVGATVIQRLAEKEAGELILVDIVEGLPQGKALDLMQAGTIMGYDTPITGTNDYADIAGSDIVIITAGIARKPGMSRDDLININGEIIRDIAGNIAEYAPNSIVINVTNPLDILTHVALKYTGFGKHRVFGMSGVLDAGRFACFVAEELRCSRKDVEALVIGGHGDLMIPLPGYTTAGGIPLTELLPDTTIEKLVDRTVHAGAEIVGLLKNGSAFYAPSAAVAEMTEAILNDSKRILPASAYLDGEYGQQGICFGVPAKLGAAGIEEILEVRLTEEQQKLLQNSADLLRKSNPFV
jgi:malate dehydrogenase